MTLLVPRCCLDYHRSHDCTYDEVVSRPQVAPALFPQAKSPHRDCQTLEIGSQGVGREWSIISPSAGWPLDDTGPLAHPRGGKPWLGAHCMSPMAEHLLADMSVPVSHMNKEKVRIENLIASRLRFKM